MPHLGSHSYPTFPTLADLPAQLHHHHLPLLPTPIMQGSENIPELKDKIQEWTPSVLLSGP